MNKHRKGTILINEKVAKDTYKLVINSNTEKVQAGQFVSILCNNKTLRRPFSVADFENGNITVLYKLKGEGTKYIASLKPNNEIDFLAPLGNTFNYNGIESALLIGAGIGIAPMLFLKKELQNNGVKNFLITGFKAEDEIIEGSDKNIIGGSVMDNIDKVIAEVKPEAIYSCGPSIVLKLVCEAAERNNIKAQVAMEKVMACGIGVCRGCVIKLKTGQNATVCKDGPVFRGELIEWN